MMKLYKGELGEFLYNDSLFRVVKDSFNESLRYIGNGEKIQLPEGLISCREMFKDCKADKLDFSIIDTSNIKDFSFMFTDSNIKEIDLTNFDFKNGEYFTGMFLNIFSTTVKDGVLKLRLDKPSITLPSSINLSEGVLKELCDENVILKDNIYYFKQDFNFENEPIVNHIDNTGELRIIQKINDGTYLLKRETDGEYVATTNTEYYNKYIISNNKINVKEGIVWGQGRYLGKDIFGIDMKKLERDLNHNKYIERENELKKDEIYMCKELFESFVNLTNGVYKDIISKELLEKIKEEKEDLFYNIEDIESLEYDLRYSRRNTEFITDKIKQNIEESKPNIKLHLQIANQNHQARS